MTQDIYVSKCGPVLDDLLVHVHRSGSNGGGVGFIVNFKLCLLIDARETQ